MHSFILPVQLLDKVLHMPVVVLRQVPGLMVQKTVEPPQLQSIFSRRIPFVPQKQNLMVQTIQRIIEIPQLPLVIRWSMSLLFWSCRFSGAAVEKIFFLSAGPDARHPGWYGSQEQLCRDTAVLGWFCW